MDELKISRRKRPSIEELQEHLAELERQNRLLRRRLEEDCRNAESEQVEKIKASETMKIAELIINNSPAILFRRLSSTDPKKRKMVYVSPNISQFGYRAEDFLEGRIMYRDILYSGDLDRMTKEIQAFADRNTKEYTQVYRIVTRGGSVRWVEDRTSVVEDPETGVRYNQGIVIDIHRRKEAEERLRKSEEKYRRIVETTAEGFLLLDEDMNIRDVNDAFCRIIGTSRSDLFGRALFEIVTEESRPSWFSGRQEPSSNDILQFEGNLRTRGGRLVPALIHGSVLLDDNGAIIGNMAFVTDMTEQKKALTLAAEVQRSLLPRKSPQVVGLDVAGRNISCDGIGGDYFDFLQNDGTAEGPFTVVVGDITGHGVDSALLMTTARAFLRMRASQPGSITDIVTAMNRHLVEDVHETGKFMTLFYLNFSRDRCRIEWVRAGHDPAWLFDPNRGIFEQLRGPGLALGVNESYSYRPITRTGLKKGELIVVGTDGIWEGRNPAGKMFGKSRFKKIIRRNAASSAETILNAVFEEHSRFTRGTRAEDDITLVVVKIE